MERFWAEGRGFGRNERFVKRKERFRGRTGRSGSPGDGRALQEEQGLTALFVFGIGKSPVGCWRAGWGEGGRVGVFFLPDLEGPELSNPVFFMWCRSGSFR